MGMSHDSTLQLDAPFGGFLRSPVNWLLLFVPVTVALEHVGPAPPPVLFFSAALAIVPVAALMVRATEQLATRTGDAAGGLLNATFGNAPELIISLVALRAGYLNMVRASLVGAILANLLLALGVAFLLGGLRHHEQRFNPTAARAYSTMMFMAAVSMIVPSAFSRYVAPQGVIRQEQLLNIGIAVLLLVAAVLAAWMSEILVGAAEGTGKALGMSDIFIGIVLLAVVGGAAESGSAVATARKNKMDLSVGIALGSCIQIALFVAPVLVLVSYFIAPEPLELAFNRAEVGSLLVAVLIGALVCGDGQSNWYKGVQLITVYAIIALMFYLIPALT